MTCSYEKLGNICQLELQEGSAGNVAQRSTRPARTWCAATARCLCVFTHASRNSIESNSQLITRYWTKNACFEFLYNFCLNIFSFYEELSEIWSKTCIVFIQSTLFSCPILIKFEFSPQIFEKLSNIKFHENPSSGSRVLPCGRTVGQTWRS
jgi:hypothetical protein